MPVSARTLRNGNRTIAFSHPNGKRPKIRLGRVDLRYAQSFKVKVESLAGSLLTGHPPADEVNLWVMKLEQPIADRLAEVGLIPRRQPVEQATLGRFLATYIAGRDSKPLTVVNLQRAADLLTEHFGQDEPLAAITQERATAWRDWLRTPKPTGKGMGVNTSRRHTGRARQFFAAAVRRKFIAESPFRELTASLVANRSRDRFVTRDEARAISDACPNLSWRLLWNLVRFAGLRCPSEVFTLRWSDVNWDRELITITSPKTEHHDGKESRIIPIFEELRPHLDAAYHAAPEGNGFCVTGIGRKNCGTHMKRIIVKAGIKPWPKLFVNCRASRETELADTFPIQTVVAWIGHSPKVALKNYLQVPIEHYRRAVGTAGQIVGQQIATDDAIDSHDAARSSSFPEELAIAGVSDDFQYPRQDSNL